MVPGPTHPTRLRPPRRVPTPPCLYIDNIIYIINIAAAGAVDQKLLYIEWGGFLSPHSNSSSNNEQATTTTTTTTTATRTRTTRTTRTNPSAQEQQSEQQELTFSIHHASCHFSLYVPHALLHVSPERARFFSAAADISKAGSGAFEQVKLQLFLAFRMFLE